MLAVGIIVFVAKGIRGVNRSRTFLMATGGDVLVGIGTLYSGAVKEIDDLGRTRCRCTVSHLAEVIRGLHIIARVLVLLKEELSGVDVHAQVIALHIRHIVRAAGLKTVVHAEAVDVISVIRARQSVHGNRQAVG